mmetsp:Transcript_10545/g.22506  ORF Transcript_10545/g.22506 Transcript_10545/m.22506 type:complete len:278 (+) Transcript_10545:454-1287(+)
MPHIPRPRLDNGRGMPLELRRHDVPRLPHLLHRQMHRGLVLLPIEEISVISVLSFQSLDELGVIPVVFGENVGHLVNLFWVVFFVEGDDPFFGGGSDAETEAEVAEHVFLLHKGTEVVSHVEEGGEDGRAGEHDEHDKGEGFDALFSSRCRGRFDGGALSCGFFGSVGFAFWFFGRVGFFGCFFRCVFVAVVVVVVFVVVVVVVAAVVAVDVVVVGGSGGFVRRRRGGEFVEVFFSVEDAFGFFGSGLFAGLFASGFSFGSSGHGCYISSFVIFDVK